MFFFVHGCYTRYFPFAARELPLELAIESVEEQVPEAAFAFTGPEKP